MMLIHPPVNPYSPAREIRAWIEVLEGWRTEPIDDEQDLWFIDLHLTNAREWLERAEKNGPPTGAGPTGLIPYQDV